MKQFKPHEQRVIAERDELAVRISALEDFVNSSPIYTTLPSKDRQLLTKQLEAMRAYLFVLDARIELF